MGGGGRFPAALTVLLAIVHFATVQAWSVRGAYMVSQLVSYALMATLYLKAKVPSEAEGKRSSN